MQISWVPCIQFGKISLPRRPRGRVEYQNRMDLPLSNILHKGQERHGSQSSIIIISRLQIALLCMSQLKGHPVEQISEPACAARQQELGTRYDWQRLPIDNISLVSSPSLKPFRCPCFTRHLFVPLIYFNQERCGSKSGGRIERILCLLDRRSFVGHAGLIPSFRRLRRVREYPPDTRWRSRSLNSERGSTDGVQQRGRGNTGKKNSEMLMDVVEATSVRSQARWGGPYSMSIETLVSVVVLLVALVLVQLRFSPVPRLLVILSSSFSCLVQKVDSKVPKHQKRTIEALDEIDFKLNCLDYEAARREKRSVHREDIYNILNIIPDEDVDGLKITEKYEVNSRKIEIFSKSWIPETGKPKAAICFCHGYGDTCTFFFEGIARKLAAKNFAVFSMDYAGFGLSGGLHGYVPKFDLLVGDVAEHFSLLKKQEEFKDLPFFLMGESMGGAVALKTHFRAPDFWDGAVLIAPMCKIAEEMYPPWYLLGILKLLARVIPKAKLVPSGDIAEIGFQDLKKRQQAMQNIIAYVGKPRLATALSLLWVTDEIEQHLDKVSLPLLILHGAEDRVTDPAVSRALYEQACTQDKTLHIYENTWHAVLEGETDEAVDRAIEDIVKWLDAHSATRHR